MHEADGDQAKSSREPNTAQGAPAGAPAASMVGVAERREQLSEALEAWARAAPPQPIAGRYVLGTYFKQVGSALVVYANLAEEPACRYALKCVHVQSAHVPVSLQRVACTSAVLTTLCSFRIQHANLAILHRCFACCAY